MHKLLNKKEIVFLFFLFLIPARVLGADIFFESGADAFSIDKEFVVEVLIDPKGDLVNAISGEILFNPDFLEIKEFRDGNSKINFWIEKPNNKIDDRIVFSGITPGAIPPGHNFLFSIVFVPRETGNTRLEFGPVDMFRNDGNGSKIEVKKSSFIANIDNNSVASVQNKEDIEPPENFKPEVALSEDMFDGKYFLVFATQDKGVGIERYEVKEGFWGKYLKAESPYMLEGQKLNKKIYIKAIDKNGNERVVGFNPGNKSNSYQYIILLVIIILFIMFVTFKKRWNHGGN